MSKHQTSLSLENEQTDAGRDGRMHFARSNSQVQTGTDKKIFIFSFELTTSRIGNLTRLIHTLLYICVMTIDILWETFVFQQGYL